MTSRHCVIKGSQESKKKVCKNDNFGKTQPISVPKQRCI